MSHYDFNFKSSNTQKQMECFNDESKKNEFQGFQENLENKNETQNYSNSSSSWKDDHRKISSPLIKRTQNIRRFFQGQVEAKYFNKQWNTFQQTSEYFIKIAKEEKKQKLCQKKPQESESNSSKTIYEVMIFSLIIGYFVSMIYIISIAIFF